MPITAGVCPECHHETIHDREGCTHAGTYLRPDGTWDLTNLNTPCRCTQRKRWTQSLAQVQTFAGSVVILPFPRPRNPNTPVRYICWAHGISEEYDNWDKANLARIDHETTDPFHTAPKLGTSHYHWSVTLNILRDLWSLADGHMDALMEAKALTKDSMIDPNSEVGQGAARTVIEETAALKAQAEMLCKFWWAATSMPEVSRELARRYKARQAGEAYETPGLAGRIYEPVPGKIIGAPDAQSVADKRTQTLDAELDRLVSKADQDQIISSLKQGWEVEMLMGIYGVTAAQVKRLQVRAEESDAAGASDSNEAPAVSS